LQPAQTTPVAAALGSPLAAAEPTPGPRLASPAARERGNRAGGEMSRLFRGLVAGAGAYKLGGGCGCGALVIFLILWWLLGASGIQIFQ
jgi:predicted lipid-binding transport protein (Tim44 family)